MKATRNKLFIIITVILIISGISFCLFPTVSNIVGKEIAQNEIEIFNQVVDNIIDDTDENGNPLTYTEALSEGKIDDAGYLIDSNGNRISSTSVIFQADLDRLYEDSIAYNENLKENQGKLLVDETSYINPSLDLTDYGIFNGIYGYISISSINLNLPIYLGANNTSMSYGAAHLTYTSLPIGGESTNTVLAGHTGYFGRILLDNLKNLEIGDSVVITNYWYSISYKVVSIEVNDPDQTQGMYISKNKDLLTLVTCADGGKSRYYVTCERS